MKLKSLLAPPPKPVRKETKVPDYAQPIVDLWEQLGLHRMGRETKMFKNSIDGIRDLYDGSFFNSDEFSIYIGKKFTRGELEKSIRNFAIAALNPEYEPLPGYYKEILRKSAMDSFFFNAFSGTKSLFIKYLLAPPKKISVARKAQDNHPAVSRRLIEFFTTVQAQLGRKNYQCTDKDRVYFIRASDLLVEFYRKNKSKISSYWVKNELDFASTLCSAIQWDIENNLGDGFWQKFEPSWFCSETTFTKRLPKYLDWDHLWERK